MWKLCPASILFVLLLSVLAVAEEPADSKEADFAKAFPMVAYREGASDEVKSLAKEFANTIGLEFVHSWKGNPLCCVWIEITGQPNPGKPGYFILHQPGGSIISASDTKQLALAIERFKKSAQKNGKTLEFPVGLMTNYRVVDTAKP